jgi:hypothetical protein
MLSEDAFIMPCKGILKLCAMSLPVRFSHAHLSVMFLQHRFLLRKKTVSFHFRELKYCRTYGGAVAALKM